MALIISKMTKAEHFSSNDTILSQYILNNIELVLSMSIYELSSLTHISTAGIVRFCKKCGATGFKNFKILLARDYEQKLLTTKDIDPNTPFEKNDDPLTISSKISKLSIETILATQHLLTTKKLNTAISLIKGAQNIYGIGVSSNYIRLSDFQLKLLQINYHVQLIPLQAEQFYLSIHSTENDLAIIASRSGSTAEIVNDAKHFRQNGTPIIAVTDDEHNPLALYSTVVLLIPQKENSPFEVSNFSSQISVEYLFNTLYSCLFNRDYKRNYNNLRKTPKSHF
ncbi:putative HTH-type transcriptional regulator YbbH [Companilactobacillus paralimentarius]|uniref:MurR/RpiR family transcriptional regulator n=1 Tax=Companilactobacillus paralimentarius TaxID=83526 RepID=UPI0038517C1A